MADISWLSSCSSKFIVQELHGMRRGEESLLLDCWGNQLQSMYAYMCTSPLFDWFIFPNFHKRQDVTVTEIVAEFACDWRKYTYKIICESIGEQLIQSADDILHLVLCSAS